MAGTSSRGNPSLGDIVRSVGVLGVIVLVVFGVAQIFTVTPDRPVEGQDLGQTVQTARETVTAFDVLAPTSLPEEWLVSSSQARPDAWNLNVLTASDAYVGLQQGRTSEAELVGAREGDFEEVGPVDVGGQEWTTWEAGSETAYTRSDGDAATLVLGTAPQDQIEDFIGLLSTGPS